MSEDREMNNYREQFFSQIASPKEAIILNNICKPFSLKKTDRYILKEGCRLYEYTIYQMMYKKIAVKIRLSLWQHIKYFLNINPARDAG